MTLWTELSWTAMGGSLAILLGVVIGLLVRRRADNRHVHELDFMANDTDEAVGFDLEHYRPMEHLLAGEDLVFLQSQPGYDAAMGRRWQRERRRIFRLYFAELKRDFRRLHAEARRLVVHADADSADHVGMLLRQRWSFELATANLEIRLALAWAGIGKVDATPLIALLEAMQIDISRRAALHAA